MHLLRTWQISVVCKIFAPSCSVCNHWVKSMSIQDPFHRIRSVHRQLTCLQGTGLLKLSWLQVLSSQISTGRTIQFCARVHGIPTAKKPLLRRLTMQTRSCNTWFSEAPREGLITRHDREEFVIHDHFHQNSVLLVVSRKGKAQASKTVWRRSL